MLLRARSEQKGCRNYNVDPTRSTALPYHFLPLGAG